MKRVLLLLFLISLKINAQSDITRSDSLIYFAKQAYFLENYSKAAEGFSKAFEKREEKCNEYVYYFASISFLRNNQPDKALEFQRKFVENSQYAEYDYMIQDSTWLIYWNDQRWIDICSIVHDRQNRRVENLIKNKQIIDKLDQILIDDQAIRNQLTSVQQNYGVKSEQADSVLKIMATIDSINTQVVTEILDVNGWMSALEIGFDASNTLFLVIQHALPIIQEKYLPLLEKAKEEARFDPGSFAMLEDRININNKKPQKYGTQLAYDSESKCHYLSPVYDPEQLDLRRDKVGLFPEADYLSYWGITWDFKVYISKLPYYTELMMK